MNAEREARLMLERQTAGVFRLFFNHAPALLGQEFTILAFDFGDYGHVAYKTTLPANWLIRTFDYLMASWSGGPKICSPPGVYPGELKELAKAIREALPDGIGFALVIGMVERVAYVSSAHRSDIRALVETELLPAWRKEAVG